IRCAGAGGCCSAELGSPTVKTFFYCLNLAVIPLLIFQKPICLQKFYSAASTPQSTLILGTLPGISLKPLVSVHYEERGNMWTSPPLRAILVRGSRLLGGPWMPSTRKRNGSWAMLPTVTIELTSAKLRAISWFVIATASSRTLSGLWSSTSPVLL